MAIDIRTIIPGGARLGEGALWDCGDQKLWWVDIDGGLIHTYRPLDEARETFDFGEAVGCIARREEGFLVVAARSGFWFFDPYKGEKHHIADPEASMPENRFNDGTVDSHGRFWAGSMRDIGPRVRAGRFYRLDTDLTVTAMDGFYTTTNGLAFSPGGDVMYWAETHRDIQTIWSGQYDQVAGKIRAKQVFFDARNVAGRPDGGTVDEEGYYWMAGVGGWQVYRISPAGEVVFTLDVPVEKPTKPMFGGKGLDVLYLTSIGFGLTEGTEADQPDAGGVFAISGLGVRGLPQHRFDG